MTLTDVEEQRAATTRRGVLGGRWIDHWEPEDPGFWARTGRRIAHRNLETLLAATLESTLLDTEGLGEQAEPAYSVLDDLAARAQRGGVCRPRAHRRTARANVSTASGPPGPRALT